MKIVSPILCLIAALGLCSGCVSRTSTVEKAYGDDLTEKKIIWIWQKEYRNK